LADVIVAGPEVVRSTVQQLLSVSENTFPTIHDPASTTAVMLLSQQYPTSKNPAADGVGVGVGVLVGVGVGVLVGVGVGVVVGVGVGVGDASGQKVLSSHSSIDDLLIPSTLFIDEHNTSFSLVIVPIS
jgi:hypothetical protein